MTSMRYIIAIIFVLTTSHLASAQCIAAKTLTASATTICPSDASPTITILNAEDEVTYCLVKNSSLVSGSCKERSGLNVSWTVTTSGEYKVYGTKTGCSGVTYMSNTIDITFTSPGTLAITPSSPSPVCFGDFVTLTATGGQGNYKWSTLGGVIDSDSTKSTFKVEHTGYYRVSGDVGCNTRQTTSYVSVTVYDPVGGGTVSGPSIVCISSAPSFTSSASATGAGSFTYQWEVQSPGGSWSDIAGATGLTCIAPAITSTKVYRRKVTTSCGTAYSNIDTVKVANPPSVGVVGGSEGYGSTTDTLSVTGNSHPIIKWQKQIGSTWTDIASSASPTLIVSNVSTSTSYRTATQNSPCPIEYSSPGTITIYPVPAISVSGPATITFGSTTKLEVGSGFYSYQWYRNGLNIPGAISRNLKVVSAGEYRVQVKGSATSGSYTTAAKVIGSKYDDPLNDYNYIQTVDFQVAGVTSSDSLFGLEKKEYNFTTAYFDGLSRPEQTVQLGASPGGKDVVQSVVYDHLNRESRKYLPYADDETTGDYKQDAILSQAAFYNTAANVAHDLKPYSETSFEQSPLNRVVEQGAVGTAWQPGTNHTIKKEYLTNSDASVLRFYFNPTLPEIFLQAEPPSPGAFFPPNMLSVVRTIDEDGNDVLEYVDKQGRTICKKVKAPDNKYACTYYVYDDLGNLVVVIPPQGVEQILNPNGN